MRPSLNRKLYSPLLMARLALTSLSIGWVMRLPSANAIVIPRAMIRMVAPAIACTALRADFCIPDWLSVTRAYPAVTSWNMTGCMNDMTVWRL